MDNDKVISKLNDLIEICKDGQEGFRQAAERVVNADLKTYFNEQSLIRARMMGDLQAEVVSLGGDPDKHGSIGGSLHRIWFSVKSAMGVSDQSILNSVETGEDTAVKTYQDVLKELLPTDLMALVEKQYVSIKAAHDRIRMLRDSGQYKTKTA